MSALVLFVGIVGLEVVFVLCCAREGGLALVTLVMAYCVDRFYMPPEVDLAPEGLLTLVTLYRTFLVVQQQVSIPV